VGPSMAPAAFKSQAQSHPSWNKNKDRQPATQKKRRNKDC